MDPAFAVHKLNERGMKKAERLAAAFDTHLSIVQEICGEPSEVLISSTMLHCVEHLELASFYAKKTLARRGENQIGPIEEAGKAFVADTVAALQEQRSPSTVNEILRLVRGAKFTDRERDMIVKTIIERS